MPTARATYTGTSGLWHGAIKVGNTVVWQCPHNHKNRDQGSKFAGRAACACASNVLRFALMDDAQIAAVKADSDAYNRSRWSSMSPMPPVDNTFELSQRETVRAALSTLQQ